VNQAMKAIVGKELFIVIDIWK